MLEVIKGVTEKYNLAQNHLVVKGQEDVFLEVGKLINQASVAFGMGGGAKLSPASLKPTNNESIALVRNFSTNFAEACMDMDQGEAFALIKKLSYFLTPNPHDLEQKFPSLDALMAAAPEAQKKLVEEMQAIAKKVPGIDVKDPGMKRRPRAEAKIRDDYFGDHNRIKDICRACFITQKESDFKALLTCFKLAQKTGYKAYEIKNIFKNTHEDNYADMKLIKNVDGVFVEIQFIVKEIYDVKRTKSHPLYKQMQGIERSYKEGEEWSVEDLKKYDELDRQMKDMFIEAWSNMKKHVEEEHPDLI